MKKIFLTMPNIIIRESDINVDIESLEYIFEKTSANKLAVTATAYNACVEDAFKDVRNENTVFELAQENAKNTILGLLNPFINQLDQDYQIIFNWEDK